MRETSQSATIEFSMVSKIPILSPQFASSFRASIIFVSCGLDLQLVLLLCAAKLQISQFTSRDLSITSDDFYAGVVTFI